MKEFKTIIHAVYECKYHIVWCPKYRFRILQGDVGRYMRGVIKELCAWKQIEIISGNVQYDHIHMVISFPPKYSVAEVMGYVKGKSAIRIFERCPDLKKRYWGRYFWAKGYCVSTVGLDEEAIKAYVKNQQQIEQKMEQMTLWHK